MAILASDLPLRHWQRLTSTSAHLSDFILHYRSTSFHVHKFVLSYHSIYFRTYIEPLIDGQPTYPPDECDDHPSIAHCIHLPDKCGKIEADLSDFRLFLCHLYFARHYSCIPFLIASSVDLTAQPPPSVTLDYREFRDRKELVQETHSTSPFHSDSSAQYVPVMSLCHYFDCPAVLSRAEDNCLLLVEAKDAHSRPANDVWDEVWQCFQLAVIFDLQRVKKACMLRLATCSVRASRHRQEWESIRKLVDKDTAFDMLQATLDVLEYTTG